LIFLKKENSSLIIHGNDENLINNPIIKSSLSRLGFDQDKEKKVYYCNKGNFPEIIGNVIQFFKEYEEPIELDSECKGLFQQKVDSEEDFEKKREEGQRIKNLLPQPDITIPFMNSKNRLQSYQIMPVLHSTTIGNTANFSVPGSGKTWMAYSTYFLLKNKNESDKDKVDKLLVVGPLSAFRPWEKEYEIMTGKKPNSVRITGNPTQRQKIFETSQNYEIFLVSYATATIEESSIIQLLQQSKFMMVLDESHHIKNPYSKAAIALLNIANSANRRMILTGTMAPQSLEDLWTQFTFLYPDGRLVGSFDRFKFNLAAQNACANITRLLSPFYTRISKRSLNLPTPKFVRLPVPMKEIQRRIYSTIAGHIRKNDPNYREDIFALRKWRRNSLVYLLEASTDPSLLTKNSQFNEDLISSEGLPIQDLLEKYKDLETPAKLETVKILTEQAIKKNEKILIWCSFIGTIKKLESMLESFKPLTIFGAIPRDDEADEEDNRELRIESFHTDPERNVLIANPASLAESVSLHKVCHHAIYVDRTFNCGNYLQSLERIHRIGMNPDVETKYTILHSENSIDSDVDSRLDIKKKRMERFLEEDDFNTLNLELDYNNCYGPEEELDDDYQAVLEHLKKL